MMAAPRAVPRIVFDFAGVVFGWQPLELIRRCLPHRAPDDTAARRLQAAIFEGYGGDWAEFDRGCIETGALVQRIAQRTALPAADVRAVVDAVPHALIPRADTVALLARLRAEGAVLHFLSNMPLPYAEHLDRRHPDVLAQFRSGVYSARVQLIKPEPAIFAAAAAAFGAAAGELVLLDDILANVQAARASGWQALQFSDAASGEAGLRAQGWWPAGRR